MSTQQLHIRQAQKRGSDHQVDDQLGLPDSRGVVDLAYPDHLAGQQHRHQDHAGRYRTTQAGQESLTMYSTASWLYSRAPRLYTRGSDQRTSLAQQHESAWYHYNDGHQHHRPEESATEPEPADQRLAEQRRQELSQKHRGGQST